MSALTEVLRAVAEDVRDRTAQLNELDGRAGDGDLGVTMDTAAKAVLALLPSLDRQPPADVLRTLGATLAREAPSTAGTLVATGLLRAARVIGGGAGAGASADAGAGSREGASTDAGADAIAAGLEAARAGIAERGRAELGSKTMLDALAPAAAAAAAEAVLSGEVAATLAAAAEAADAGARATVEMTPRHGRAGWLAERSVGAEDGGARLVAIALAAAAAARTETRA